MLLQLTIKLAVGFVALFIVTRIVGGRELKHLTVFDFISAIVLSELVGSMLYDTEVNVLYMLYSLVIWTALNYVIDKWTLKNGKVRNRLDGIPQIVIARNKIDKQMLAKHRIDLDELLSLLRDKGVFSIREIGHAYLEPNGSLAVLKTDSINKGRSAADMVLPLPVIMDGRVISRNLKITGKNEAWLTVQLQQHGYKDPSQIFYAEHVEGMEMFIQPQPEHEQSSGNT